MRGNPAIRHGCDETTSTQGVDANLIGSSSTGDSADWRRVSSYTSAPGADAATSSADGCKRLAPEKFAGSRAAGLHDEAERHQAGLDSAYRRATTTQEDLSMAGPRQGTNGAELQTKKTRKRKRRLQRKPQSGTKFKQEPSAGQTIASTNVEALSVLTQTSTVLQYRQMTLETSDPGVGVDFASSHELESLCARPYDGRIEQICIIFQTLTE
ncbi:unnamed protein product [Phytophthora lilii]|uniref:Unnamed protein product n=1 Tax=Phytophthora lilii TaxID=2077276 RepID=A0A9W6X8I2_9STRA|nr:unnamed protein product [Phytophthora lilii]